MCLTPLTLDISRVKRYYNFGDPLRKDVVVPCGKCAECQMTVRNDLLLRTRAEYDDCVNHGGKVAFLTFTYDESHVPCYTYDFERVSLRTGEVSPSYSFEDVCSWSVNFRRISRDEIGYTVPHDRYVFGFDKVQFRNFLKVIRQTLCRAGKNFGIKSKDLKNSLRYICVSEYGTDSRYTQRPHYHVLFFLSPLLLKVIDSLDCVDFTAFCNKYWKYGNVSASKDGLYLNSINGCEYVAKYVTKANELLKLRNFQHLLDSIEYHFIRGHMFLHDDGVKPYAKPYSYFSHVVRTFGLSYFVIKSLNFGVSLVQEIKESDDPVSKISHGLDVVKYGVTRQYKYPSYILRKVLYNNRKDGTYYLNSFGLSIFMEKELRDYFALVDSTGSFLQTHLVYLSQQNTDKYNFYALVNFSLRMPFLLFYQTFVRGRVFPYDVIDEVSSFMSEFDSLFADRSSFCKRVAPFIRRLMDAEIFDEVEDILPDDFPPESSLFSHEQFGFLYPDGVSSLQVQDYDYLIDNYMSARSYLGTLKCAEYSRKNSDLKLVSDVLNDSVYNPN